MAELKDHINKMIDNLRLTTERTNEQDWLKSNLARFASLLQGQRDLAAVGRLLLSELAKLVDAQQGVVYHMRTSEGVSSLHLVASFADHGSRSHKDTLALGEGLVGQCAVDRTRSLITNLPASAIPISSGLFEAVPRSVIVLPVLFEDKVKAVIELASLHDFTPLHTAFLEQLTLGIGIVLNTIETTMQTEGLLEQSQDLAAELQTRQTELQATNEQLEKKAAELVEQKEGRKNAEVERKNAEIEQARLALEDKASELAMTSRYKSEFLANMSHELRTPLNSILILGQQLAENAQRNLTDKQVEFASMIHAAGVDLMNLISDILDLSKIESGTVTIDVDNVSFAALSATLERTFRLEAERRKLGFQITLDPRLDPNILTDSKRLLQVLKNLLSNAFKFTEHGSVRLNVRPAAQGWHSENRILKATSTVVAFEVVDAGIGIAPDKQKIIFEAFQQAEAGTSRKYGGTGLGLAICRELATLLGGEIHLHSVPGAGSTFTLYLPIKYSGSASPITGTPRTTPVALSQQTLGDAPQPIADDRARLESGRALLLVVEDDPVYANVLVDLAHEQGFQVVRASRGAEALALAREYRPTAISLDINLPDMHGWAVLCQLKDDPATRHIPVQIVTLEEDQQHGLARGAFAFVTKSATADPLKASLARIKEYCVARRKRLLVVEDDNAARLSIVELLAHDDIEISVVDTGVAALAALGEHAFDCAVVDLRLPDMSGFALLEQIHENAALQGLPIVVYTGRELSAEEDAQLQRLAKSVVLKGVESPERLLDETALFLHRVVTDLPPSKQRLLEQLRASDEGLAGKQVLVADDDVRNIFALSSVLERHGIKVLTASTGREAIARLEQTPDIAAVLMDIMMPEMDGYQTMRIIRENPAFRRLPIIALTAKAMSGDRAKCLEAGASDYLAKPVNTDHLRSALRMWLRR